MSGWAYYNEIDPKAAAWLRELIKHGHIAPGIVDERSIEDVQPNDLAGFSQCHFFAGIGVWSYALRLAGWPDDRPVWTGSCPCQPFSQAGRGDGFADERHLWPAWLHLIAQRRPPVLFGEQVASKDGLAWLDLVQSDLEGAGYASRAADLCAAGVGAPHIRQRLWIVAADVLGDTERPRREGGLEDDVPGAGRGREGRLAVESGGESAGRLADDDGDGRGRSAAPRLHERRDGAGSHEPTQGDADGALGHDADRRGADDAGPTNGHWADCEWVWCRDGKYRPLEPGTPALAHGAAARMGRLRGYGNAIVSEAARLWIEACDAEGLTR